MASILVVSELFWPEGGGAELATYLILDILAKHNFGITVVTGTKNPAKIRGARYCVAPYLRGSNRIVKWVKMEMLGLDKSFKEMLNNHDILYIPLVAYPLIPLVKRNGLKVVVHLHNYAPIRYSSIKYYLEPEAIDTIKEFRYAIFHEFHIQKSILRTLLCPLSYTLYPQSRKWVSQADKVICVSKRQAEIIADRAPELRDKIEVVYNPLPPEMINAEPRKELDDTPTFLYVGGDSYVKGFHVLLQALSKLGKQGTRARFIFTNKYSTRSLEALRRLSYKYGNLDIQVLGRIEYEKLKEQHMEAWALLFPSIWEEPLPYAVVEAMTLGTIPIAARVGGVTEFLNDTNAQQFMISPGSVNDLAKRISMITSLTTDEVKVLGFKLREEILWKLDSNKIERRIIEIFGEGY
jgi:glycosyltransferase involved in cell wall biosynthesis